jgi:CBS domain-containing protein
MSPTKQVATESCDSTHDGRTCVTPQTATIRAKDIMTTDVVWVDPSKTIREIAQLISERHISAVPVVDSSNKIVGIVSEGDLIQREELGTSTTLSGQNTRGANADYAKSHGMYASDVMTRNVITVSEDTSLAEIAEIMQTERIKRVPVTRDAKLVGIVSRSNIVQTLATRPLGACEPTDSDDNIIRFKVIETLMDMPGTSPWLTTIDVLNGVVEVSGTVEDETTLEPSRVAIEHIAHVVEVKDRRSIPQPY